MANKTEGKKALAKLAKLKVEAEHLDQQLEQKLELEKELGCSVFNQAEVDELFILDKEQWAPFLRGKERKPNGQLIALARCKFKKGRPDFFYLYRKGMDVRNLQKRWSVVGPKQTEKELIKEGRELADQAAEKASFLTIEDRYQPEGGKKETRKEMLKRRYGI